MRALCAGVWGLARSVRSETNGEMSLICTDASLLVAARWAAYIDEDESILSEHSCSVPRLRRAPGTDDMAMAAYDVATQCHIVTGGTSGVGLLTARWLAQCGATGLILASRSGALARDAGAEWDQLRQADRTTRLERCDAGELNHMRRLAAQSPSSLLEGVWHAAGVVADALLPNQDAFGCGLVYAPKAHGAWALHSACSTHLVLRSCVLFASGTGLFGDAAQANYAGANVSLDALSACRRAHGHAAVSVQWG